MVRVLGLATALAALLAPSEAVDRKLFRTCDQRARSYKGCVGWTIQGPSQPTRGRVNKGLCKEEFLVSSGVLLWTIWG